MRLKLIAVVDYQTRIVVHFNHYNYASNPNFLLILSLQVIHLLNTLNNAHVTYRTMSIDIDGDLVVQDSLSPFWIADEMQNLN